VIRDLPAIRTTLGLTTGGLAALLGVDVRTVQRYLDGSIAVPEPTWRLLNLTVSLPGARASLERMVG
jgi:hypothetical protein